LWCGGSHLHRDCPEKGNSHRHAVIANWWKERRYIPPTTAAAGMQRNKCSRRRNHRKHSKAKLEGCFLPTSQSQKYLSLQLSEARLNNRGNRRKSQAVPKPQKLRRKETDQSVPATIVNSEPQDKALKALTVVQQIKKELKGAPSEEDLALAITKIVIKLKKEDGE
jgi:hypothetical protein